MVEHRVVGNLEDIVLQFLQRSHTTHLFMGLRIAEDEVAESHVFFYHLSQVNIHLLTVLVDEVKALGFCLCAVFAFATLQNEWHIFIALAYLAQQFQSSLSIAILHLCQLSVWGMHGESGIADDAQGIFMILLIDAHRILVVGGKHHFGASSFALCCSMWIERFGRESLTLCQNIVVEVGQYRGVETYIVLYEEYHLHASLVDIVLDIHPVFYQFDDREYEVGVSQPAEHIVEDRHILVFYTFGDTV